MVSLRIFVLVLLFCSKFLVLMSDSLMNTVCILCGFMLGTGSFVFYSVLSRPLALAIFDISVYKLLSNKMEKGGREIFASLFSDSKSHTILRRMCLYPDRGCILNIAC